MIREAADAQGGIRALGRAWGVDYSYLSRIISGERVPGPEVLDAIGVVSVTTYKKKV
jgi:hypothetical protein